LNGIYEFSGFAITATAIENGRQIIEMASTQGETNCPRCQQKSDGSTVTTNGHLKICRFVSGMCDYPCE
jgi:hypothetical protein